MDTLWRSRIQVAEFTPCLGVYKVKATVEYDGTDYKGFQIQPHGPTIQEELEKALKSVTRVETRVVGAGRTDAGVHAKGQVVHFMTCWPHPVAVLERAWNAMLPGAIAVRDLRVVPDHFHARFSASSREYRYSIYTGERRQPLKARFAYYLAGTLALDQMEEAARYLNGTHDFSAFGQSPWGDNTVRTVFRAGFAQDQDMLYFDIEADAFLRRMVRQIVGTLLLVGLGRLSPDAFRQILLFGEPNHPVLAVPPTGLCLMRVNYAQAGSEHRIACT